jgi:hypothetical protein
VKTPFIRFPLGQVVTTATVAKRVPRDKLVAIVARHALGDWGTVCREDAEANRVALRDGDRLLSAYNVDLDGEPVKIYIITEADRSSTTVLFPEEY